MRGVIGLYTRDLLGRINRKVVSSGSAPRTLDYVYDSAGRLKEVWTDRSLTRAYHYDANSNRTSVVSGAGTVSAAYDSQDRLMSYGNYTFTYNARGELSQRTETGSAEGLALGIGAGLATGSPLAGFGVGLATAVVYAAFRSGQQMLNEGLGPQGGNMAPPADLPRAPASAPPGGTLTCP